MAKTTNVFILLEAEPPEDQPLSYGQLTKDQFNTEIQKGMDDIENGRVYSADEVEAAMKQDFGI